MTPSEARMLGELHGKKCQAEARLKEWPTLNDEKVVDAATNHIIATTQYNQLLKKLRKQIFDT